MEKKDSECDSCPLPYRYDDILEITDWKSKVNGKPFLFRVSVRNRKPAIDFIPDLDVDLNESVPPIQIDIPINAFDPDDSDEGLKYYFFSLGYGKDKCQGFGVQNAITTYVIQGFDEPIEIPEAEDSEEDFGSMGSITGMASVNHGESCPCVGGRQGIYAGVGGDFGGYYLKCYPGTNTCMAACGSTKADASICPEPIVNGRAGNIVGCFKPSEGHRCLSDLPVTGDWSSGFPDNSQSNPKDACIRSVDGTWYVPHGDTRGWIWSDAEPSELGAACECGHPNYSYFSSNCHPASCTIYDCCTYCKTTQPNIGFCMNGRLDCGETNIDSSDYCDNCASCTGCSPGGTSDCSCNWQNLGCGGDGEFCPAGEMQMYPLSCDPVGCDTTRCVPNPACGASGGSTGWCENDPYVSSADGGLSEPNLRMLVNKYDSGIHNIGVLVIDDSGFFDYQSFNINISDKKDIQDADISCVPDCNAFGDVGDCSQWCDISANPCRSECIGGKFLSDPSPGGCWDCVYPIYYSPSPQTHIDCSKLGDITTCNSHMPDCFWIKENITGNFVNESCYNDTLLNTIIHPAYILIN